MADADLTQRAELQCASHQQPCTSPRRVVGSRLAYNLAVEIKRLGDVPGNAEAQCIAVGGRALGRPRCARCAACKRVGAPAVDPGEGATVKGVLEPSGPIVPFERTKPLRHRVCNAPREAEGVVCGRIRKRFRLHVGAVYICHDLDRDRRDL